MRKDILAYADGKASLLDIAEIIGLPITDLIPLASELVQHDLMRPVHE
jgi:aminopeptidase-like protein